VQKVGAVLRRNPAIAPAAGVWHHLAVPTDPEGGLQIAPPQPKRARRGPERARDAPRSGTLWARGGDVDEVRAFLRAYLTAELGDTVATEQFYYTNTDDEDFVFDHHRASRAVVVGVGMSGHGSMPLT
jgi:hypothetical protein